MESDVKLGGQMKIVFRREWSEMLEWRKEIMDCAEHKERAMCE